MIKSEFTFRAYLIPILIIALTIISFLIIITTQFNELKWIHYYMSFLFLIIWVWLVFGEFRKKIIFIKIDKNKIIYKNYFGFNKTYYFKDFDGFYTSFLRSKDANHEYLYFIKNEKKIIKISEAYHKNYKELKKNINPKLKDLGQIPFSFVDETKEIFY
jgi:hypothetical protein